MSTISMTHYQVTTNIVVPRRIFTAAAMGTTNTLPGSTVSTGTIRFEGSTTSIESTIQSLLMGDSMIAHGTLTGCIRKMLFLLFGDF